MRYGDEYISGWIPGWLHVTEDIRSQTIIAVDSVRPAKLNITQAALLRLTDAFGKL
jgi:hypothetical protein